MAVKQDTTTYLNGIKIDNQADLVKNIKERLEEMADTAKVVYLKGDENLAVLRGHEGHGLLPRGGRRRDRPYRRSQGAGVRPRRHPRKKKSAVHSHDATRPAALGATSDINITPLIDVMLVLLIIFMVVTPLAQKGLDIALPQPPPPNQPADTTPPEHRRPLDRGGPDLGEQEPVGDISELEQRLRDIYQTRSDKTIFVRASGDVAYGKVVAAMDAAKGAGVERIGIISEKMLEQARRRGGRRVARTFTRPRVFRVNDPILSRPRGPVASFVASATTAFRRATAGGRGRGRPSDYSREASRPRE